MSNPIKDNKIDNPVPLIQLGPPGVVKYLLIVPKLSSNDDKDKDRVEDKTLRTFQISARFARGYESHSNISFHFDNDVGNSHFVFPENSSHIDLETSAGTITLFPNKNKRLSTARFTCIASSIGNARSIFHEIIYPVLDCLAFSHSTPVYIVQISGYDATHQISSSDIRCPYPEVLLQQTFKRVSSALAPVYAMYRD